MRYVLILLLLLTVFAGCQKQTVSEPTVNQVPTSNDMADVGTELDNLDIDAEFSELDDLEKDLDFQI